MSVEKISTVLRKACEWSGRNQSVPWEDVLSRVAPKSQAFDAAAFCQKAMGCYPLYDSEESARSIMLGLAAAIAESEGL